MMEMAVAGQNDGDGVDTVGIGHCPDGFRGTYGCGQLSVGYGLSVGYVPQLLPDALLKFTAGQEQGDVELLPLTAEIFVQFPDGP